MTYYRRRTPEWWEELAAAAMGAAAGLAAYYLARTLLRRDPLSPARSEEEPGRREDADAAEGDGAGSEPSR